MKNDSTPIRDATTDDLLRIATIHKARFSDHLLGRFSIPLLVKFYTVFLGRTIFLVHTTGGEIDGFILGETTRSWRPASASFSEATGWTRPGKPCCNLRSGCKGFAPFGARFIPREQARPAAAAESPRQPAVVTCHRGTRRGSDTRRPPAFLSKSRLPADCHEYYNAVAKTNRRSLDFYETMRIEEVRRTGDCVEFRRCLPRRGSASPHNGA